jgi:hypothetical protein
MATKAKGKKAAARKSKYVKHGRSSVTGQYVDGAEVAKHPESTTVERSLRKQDDVTPGEPDA